MRVSLTAALALLVVGFFAGYLVSSMDSSATTVTQSITVTATRATTTTQTTTATTTIRTTITAAYIVDGKPVDLAARVYRVVDGDTFDAFPSGRVRLADINTPERGEPGYTEATNALRMLVDGKTVYLDVDNVDVMDSFNRLVAVVYVDHNATHVLNVNLWLVVNRHASIRDFSNEFNPATWKLYARKN